MERKLLHQHSTVYTTDCFSEYNLNLVMSCLHVYGINITVHADINTHHSSSQAYELILILSATNLNWHTHSDDLFFHIATSSANSCTGLGSAEADDDIISNLNPFPMYY